MIKDFSVARIMRGSAVVMALAASACNFGEAPKSRQPDINQNLVNGKPDAAAEVLAQNQRAKLDAESAVADWVVSRSSDPMTDEGISTAERAFQTGPYMIAVSVKCTTKGELSYSFSSFASSGQPEKMRKYLFNDASWENADGMAVDYELRIDSLRPQSVTARKLDYDNEVHLSGSPDDRGVSVGLVLNTFTIFSLARASLITAKFPLSSGDATVTIDQRSNKFSSAVAPCLSAIEMRQAELRPAKDVQPPTDDGT